MGRPVIDAIGQRFGKLVVLERATGPSGSGVYAAWICACDCGNIKTISRKHLGQTSSCGCARDGHARHGHAGIMRSTTYDAWQSMRARCAAKQSHRHYSLYAARGITVCERWNTFESFLADMGDRPDGLTLDRIDNDKGYGPDNCRWATWEQQARNTRSYRGGFAAARKKRTLERCMMAAGYTKKPN